MITQNIKSILDTRFTYCIFIKHRNAIYFIVISNNMQINILTIKLSLQNISIKYRTNKTFGFKLLNHFWFKTINRNT